MPLLHRAHAPISGISRKQPKLTPPSVKKNARPPIGDTHHVLGVLRNGHERLRCGQSRLHWCTPRIHCEKSFRYCIRITTVYTHRGDNFFEQSFVLRFASRPTAGTRTGRRSTGTAGVCHYYFPSHLRYGRSLPTGVGWFGKCSLILVGNFLHFLGAKPPAPWFTYCVGV